MVGERSGTGTVVAHAPYNFVPFPEKRKVRYETFEELPKHDLPGSGADGLLSGELTFNIVARTPILVAEGSRNPNEVETDREKRDRRFNRDAHGRYEIPGSTLRGLIRSAVGIIGHGDLRDGVDNQKHTLMYRGLADADNRGLKRRKKVYGNVIRKDAVQAGYIRRVGDNGYEIIPAEEINGKTFTFVREQQLHREGVIPGKGIRAMYTRELLEIEEIGRPRSPRPRMAPPSVGRPDHIEDKKTYLHRYKERLDAYHDRLRRYVAQSGDQEELKRLEREYNELYGMFYSFLKTCQTRDYRPYVARRSVYITGNGEYSFRPGRGKRYECHLMSSGFMQKKQSHYLIHPPNRKAAPIQLRPEEVHSYRYDLKVKGNRVRFREFYELPENRDELKPCFYVTDGGFTYFGFTPNLRIYYWKPIGAGLPDYPAGGYDYVQALFGFAGSGGSPGYAGRLSFRSAILEGDSDAVEVRKEEVVPGQPSLSAVAMYVKQDSAADLKTLNDDYEWRGIKQYWLKPDFERPDKNLKNAQKDNDKVKAYLHLLPKGTVFRASIRFERLHDDELGLLLAALTWPKHQTIGMGKPYGAGCVTFEDLRLFLDNVTYRVDDFFADEPTEVPREQFERYIEAFCGEMRPFCGDVRETAPVRTYLAMRERVYDHIEKRYMPLSEWDGYPAYQSLLPLPTVDQLLGREPMDTIAALAQQQRDDRSSRRQPYSGAGGLGGAASGGRSGGGKPGKPPKQPFKPRPSDAEQAGWKVDLLKLKDQLWNK